MKFNQWTLGLAALGLVSLTSAARADEKPSAVMTALSATTLSGYVDTSAQWNVGDGVTHSPGYAFGGAAKADGFNLNVVDINIEKDADAADGWGAGYRVELWMGPDANTLATSSSGVAKSDFAVKNAYVDLKAPVGNGIDTKIGVFDTPIGYEVADSPNNPNFTRSWGFTIEPTTHTGVLASYTVCDMLSVSGGVADTYGAQINQRATDASGTVRESYKAYMASATFTASTNWGWVGGSTLTACVINGFNGGSPAAGGAAADQTSFYVGGTMNTPLTQLKLGAAYDYADVRSQGLTAGKHGYANAGSIYATWQATEKMSVNGRLEYASFDGPTAATFDGGTGPAGVTALATKLLSYTATVQYDLWKNVLSRAELRWDHALDGRHVFGGTGPGGFGTQKNSFEMIANVVYKF